MKGSSQAICTIFYVLATLSAGAVPSCDIFVVGFTGEVDRISPSGLVKPIATGLTAAGALTLDSSGNIYVARNSGKLQQSTITRITPSGAISVFATGLSRPTDIVFGPSGVLYASDEADEAIYKISPQGVAIPFAKIPDEPEGIGFDHNGNLFVAGLQSPHVYKVTPDGQVSVFADLHGQPGMNLGNGLALDANDNIFVNNNGGNIAKITPSGVISLFSAQNSKHLVGMIFDPGGDLLAADISNDSVNEYTSAGVGSVPFTGLHLVDDVAVPEPQVVGALFFLFFTLRRRPRAWVK